MVPSITIRKIAPEDKQRLRLTRIWKQKTIPVLFRKGKGHPLLVNLPFSNNNRAWLKQDRRNHPRWNAKFKCWEVPMAWFNDVISETLSRYGKLYIIQPFREQEKCAPACWNAKGHECQCSCMGANHGSQGPNGNWLVITDAFATRWHEKKLACRLVTKI